MRLLTRAEAAKRARVCVRTLDTILARPNAPRVTRIGRRILIHESSLAEWVMTHSE